MFDDQGEELAITPLSQGQRNGCPPPVSQIAFLPCLGRELQLGGGLAAITVHEGKVQNRGIPKFTVKMRFTGLRF